MASARWPRAALAIAIATAGVLGLKHARMAPAPGPASAPPAEPAVRSRPVSWPTPSSRPSGPGQTSASSPRRGLSSIPEQRPEWRAFLTSYGEGLRGEFNSDGRLASARGEVGTAAGASAGFSPQDPQMSIARAKEILLAAEPLIAARPELPLGQPAATTSAVSSQVYFTETRDGIPLAPLGHVTVDLGPQGELLGLYSDYVPELAVVNEATLPEARARELAIADVADVSGGPRTMGGARVIWVQESETRPGVVEGRQAYVYTVQGRQVVVDAGSGRILSRRDRRRS